MPRSRLFLPLLAALTVLTGCSHPDSAIRTVADVETKRIGLMMGTTSEKVAATMFPKASIQRFDDIMDAIAAVKAGQVDAAMTGYPTGLLAVRKNPDLLMLPDLLSDEHSSVAVRKGDTAMLAAVNEVIDELNADGTIKDMIARWYHEDPSPYGEVDVPAVTSGEPLRVGTSPTREPTTFIDGNRHNTGFEAELARRIAYKFKRPVEFRNMKFMGLIPALQTGKIDLIVTGMSATPERAEKVDFSHHYFVLHQRLVVRKPVAAAPAVESAAAPLRSEADLAHARIAVLTGSASEGFATKQYPNATLSQFRSLGDLTIAVKTGKADAALSDEDAIQELIRNDASFALFGGALQTFDVGAGFAKNNGELRQAFNTFLADLRKSGTYDDMIRRWMERHETTMPAIALPKDGHPLRVGTSSTGLPAAAIQNNELVGFDVELIKRFGASLHRPVQFDDMDFGSLIAAVTAGKEDLIAAGMFITPERQQSIDFSDSYFRTSTRAFGLASRINAAPLAKPEKPSFFSRLRDSIEANLMREKRYLLVVDGLKTTIVLSLLSTLVGTLLGGIVCFMRLSRHALLRVPAKVFIDLIRGLPVLVLLMLIFYVVFASVDISPLLVSVIAFGLNFGAYAAEIFRSGIEGIDRGQVEGGISLGFTRTSTFVHIVLPQMIQRVLPIYKGEIISLVKMTSIVGYIAVQDLTKVSDIIRSRTFDAFFPLIGAAILYFLLSWLLVLAIGQVERWTNPKARRGREARS
jgi:polar amino acid transport system substrate-binding protein